MVLSQGFTIGSHQQLVKPQRLSMHVDPALVKTADQYQLNLRVDDQFVEDDGWHAAAERFNEFINRYQNSKILYLELGVGNNTPGIIKYPFWQWTYNNSQDSYVTVNADDALFPEKINQQAVGFQMDINDFIEKLL